MEPLDIAHIAALLIRDYGLTLKLDKVALEPDGGWSVRFLDPYSASGVVRIDTRCDRGCSAYRIRESLRRGLDLDAD